MDPLWWVGGMALCLIAGGWGVYLRRLRQRQREIATRIATLPAVAENRVFLAGRSLIEPPGAGLDPVVQTFGTDWDFHGWLRVTHVNVRYRAEPGLTGAILGTWQQGEVLGWFGIASDAPEWWYVWAVYPAPAPGTPERYGWTHRDFLQAVKS